MRILVSCPHCHVRGRLRLELLGRLLLCTHCLQPFTPEVQTCRSETRTRA